MWSKRADAPERSSGMMVSDIARSTEVLAPANVFIWPGDVFLDSLTACEDWSQPQLPDSIEHYSILSVGACPDTSNHEIHGIILEIKRASASPLDSTQWEVIGDDSTQPFNLSHVDLWAGSFAALINNPRPGVRYDIVARTTDNDGRTLTWQECVDHGIGSTTQEKWLSLIADGHVKRFLVVDHTAPIAHSLVATPDQTPDSSAIFLTGNVRLSAVASEPDVASVTFAVRPQGATGPWTSIERITSAGGDTFRLADNALWSTALLNGAYELGAFAEDSTTNVDGDLSGAGAGPTHPLTVFVDNEKPRAHIVSVHRVDHATADLDSLERGGQYLFDLAGSDNYGVRQIALYYRSAHGAPSEWIPIDSSRVWPYSVQWRALPDLVVGWTYDFAAVATDLVHLKDSTDALGRIVADTSFIVVDHEADVRLITVGGQPVQARPHVRGDGVELVAHSDSSLDHVRFEFVRGGTVSVIGTVPNPLGTTVWTLNSWNTDALAEGPAQLIAVGSADMGGNLVTLATDTANIIIDRTLSVVVTDVSPVSGGLLGGFCVFTNNPVVTRTLWIRFDSTSSDSVTAVAFDWKATTDPNAPGFWHPIGQAVFDDSSNRWAYAWTDTAITCGLITLRARATDNAVPVPNDTTIIFADSVRMDNCPPIVEITNINGNPAPANMIIGRGQVEIITVTVVDSFGNGGNSSIDSVAFYYSRVSLNSNVPSDWVYIGSDTNGVPWQTIWDTAALLPGVLLLHAVAWDHAGNCGETRIFVNLVDQYPQRAWIVGFFSDSLPGCPDRLWAVTQDAATNRTTRVEFEYSVDGAHTWIHLGETGANVPFCDANQVINIWSWPLALDSIAPNAIFRAVATDNNNNFDPNPPRFSFADTTHSTQPAVFDEDWARVRVLAGQGPWLFSTLRRPDPACFVNGALVCASPGQSDSTVFAGHLDALTQPCVLNNSTGTLTIFHAQPVARDSALYVIMTTYDLAIRLLTANGGSNGAQTSEDRQVTVTVPHNGVTGDGTLWFEPAQDTAHAVPPTQPHLQLLSTVETVMSKTVTAGTQASGFRVYFNGTTLPANDTMVVAAFWDQTSLLWRQLGVNVTQRHIDRVHADSSFVDFSMTPTWRESSDHAGCPNKLRLAVFHSSLRPISAFVHFASATCPGVPDSTYFGLDSNGVRTDCRPTFWITLNEGGVRDSSSVTVFLDTVRIVHNGVTESNAFRTRTDTVSNAFLVSFAPRADTVAPWFGCLRQGRHTVQFLADGQQTAVTPFLVDVSGPDAHSIPGYISHTAVITTDLSDLESGVDTATVEARLRNCGNPADPRSVRIGAEAMTFTPLSNGRGYRATFTVQWEQVQFLFPDTLPRPADQLCVTWHVANRVCARNDSSNYLYTVDVSPPIVMAVSPVGPGGRQDTLTFGQRATIEGLVVDSARNGSGASGLNLGQLQLIIDNHAYTAADTSNAALNFHIISPPNHYNADIRFGGIGAGPEVNPYYAPGLHHVTLIAPDSLGNLEAVPFGWSYFVRASGPVVTFDTTTHTCGTWFNPARSDTFGFCVDSLAGVPIAANGIQYSVYTVRDHVRISGPTVVNPVDPAHNCVTVTLAGPFPSGETGVEIAVDAWTALYNPAVDSVSGITHSRLTYWADNFPPHVTGRAPADTLLSRNEAIDISVTYSDFSPDSGGAARGLKGIAKASAMKRTGRGSLDDNGSGVVAQRTRMTIIPPSGIPIYVAPDSANRFVELDATHARYILPQGQLPGLYTVSVHIEDCVGNGGDSTWTFRVRGLAPEITFQALPAGLPCQFDSYWSPNTPLYLRATVRERDSANVDVTGIRVDILREYACDAGICQDTLLRNAPFQIVGEQPDPLNLNQTFTLEDSFHLEPGPTATEVRILITATNTVGVSGAQLQTWIIDTTPPVITPVSPAPNGVVPLGQPVTISANYTDNTTAAQTAPLVRRNIPKTKNVEKLESSRMAKGSLTLDAATVEKPPRRGTVKKGRLDDDQGNSGVDTACVTLHLRAHSDGSERDLTGQAVKTSTTITWTDTLAPGVYTAIVSACDWVCNTGTANWDFTVGRQISTNDTIAPVITLVSPPDGSSLPLHASPTFVVQIEDAPGGELDSTSINVHLETINSQPIPGTLTIAIAENRRTATANLAVSGLERGEYTLFAQASDLSGNRTTAAFQFFVRDTVTPPGEPQLGDSIVYNYPNPFSLLPNEGGGMTRFSLPATGGAFVQIKIYDFSGQFVSTVFEGNLPSTGFEPVWRAQNDRGEQVASGVYLAHVRLKAGGQTKDQIVKVAFRNKR
ncbi:MAG TPA: hypothetical protein VGL38_10920 [bacterium]